MLIKEATPEKQINVEASFLCLSQWRLSIEIQDPPAPKQLEIRPKVTDESRHGRQLKVVQAFCKIVL